MVGGPGAAPPRGPSDGKRRLPLAPRAEVANPEDVDRPPWHWSVIGAIGVFVFWLPLAYVVNGVFVVAPGGYAVASNGAAFTIAACLSGFLVGRFGGQAGRREAAVGGAGAAVVAWLTAAIPGVLGGPAMWITLALMLGAMALLGAAAAGVGGALGVRGRPR